MNPTADSFYLPDLLSISAPFKGAKNPHYERAAAESRAWMAKYAHEIFDDPEHAAFVMGCNELLVANTYPHAGFEVLRTVCDLVNLTFAYDEISDKQSGKDARETGNVYLNALRDAGWDDGSVISRMTKEFRLRLVGTCSPRWFARFLQHNIEYIAGVAREAELRETQVVLSPDDYRELRRENSGVQVFIVLYEYSLGIDLPDEVLDNEAFKVMYWAAVDMVCWANDVFSYDIEQSKGIAGNNVVTVLMQAYGLSLQEASSRVGEVYADLMSAYLKAKAELRSYSFGSTQLDLDVARYLEVLENWPIGNINWSLEAGRYFPDPEEVKRTGLVVLRQRKY